jgi:hypothetical protein
LARLAGWREPTGDEHLEVDTQQPHERPRVHVLPDAPIDDDGDAVVEHV